MSEHSWRKHEREGWTICVRCGLVRNYDRPDSQCRGAAKIALREATGGEPTCDLECATCRYQIDPTHCADAVSGEQGPSAGDLEIVRLRRERIEQEATNLEMGGEIARLRRELGEAKAELGAWGEWADYHSSWALIDAERPPDAELRARIGELCDVVTGEEWAKSNGDRAKVLAERDDARAKLAAVREELLVAEGDHSVDREDHAAEVAKLRAELELEKKKRKADWRLIGEGNEMIDRAGKSRDLIARQRDLMERDRDEALASCRSAAQILIAEIGASGPEDIEETARRAVEVIQGLKGAAEDLCDQCAPAIEIDRLTNLMHNLIDSVTATKTRDTFVLRDIEAARAVLGGKS